MIDIMVSIYNQTSCFFSQDYVFPIILHTIFLSSFLLTNDMLVLGYFQRSLVLSSKV
jgi:hypothetical protein